MKAIKKQILEVTEKAIEMGCNVEKAIKYLDICSLSMYKAMGATGIVRSAMMTKNSFDEQQQ